VAQADVLTLVSNFGVNDVDADEPTVFYEEIVRELALKGQLIGTETIAAVAGEAVYTMLNENMEILEMHLASSGRIDAASIKALQSLFGADWRDRKGTPLAYTTDEETDGDFRLIPEPTASDTITMLRKESRTDIPTWLELPLALEIVSREFQRESDHQDIVFAELSHQLATILFQFVGVM
jgi:hypothetical protein